MPTLRTRPVSQSGSSGRRMARAVVMYSAQLASWALKDPAKVAESERTRVSLPSPHSPFFAPLPEPALRTGVTSMTDAALALLQQ